MFDTLPMAAHRGNGELVAKLLEEGEDADDSWRAAQKPTTKSKLLKVFP